MSVRVSGSDYTILGSQALSRATDQPHEVSSAAGRSTGDDQISVEISHETRALQRALTGPEEVRAERVAALKKLIAEGKYEIPAEEIAARLLLLRP